MSGLFTAGTEARVASCKRERVVVAMIGLHTWCTANHSSTISNFYYEGALWTRVCDGKDDASCAERRVIETVQGRRGQCDLHGNGCEIVDIEGYDLARSLLLYIWGEQCVCQVGNIGQSRVGSLFAGQSEAPRIWIKEAIDDEWQPSGKYVSVDGLVDF